MDSLSALTAITAAATTVNPDARSGSGGEGRGRAVALMRPAPTTAGGCADDRQGAGKFRSAMPMASYARAPFLTHLIATAQGVPQTRDRGRADPDRAISAYAATEREPLWRQLGFVNIADAMA